jgi:hypothetical protein
LFFWWYSGHKLKPKKKNFLKKINIQKK